MSSIQYVRQIKNKMCSEQPEQFVERKMICPIMLFLT